jgi:hypothetical protein
MGNCTRQPTWVALHEDVVVCRCLPMREDEQYGCWGLSIRLWLAPKGVGESSLVVGADLMMRASKRLGRCIWLA